MPANPSRVHAGEKENTRQGKANESQAAQYGQREQEKRQGPAGILDP
jgi:hypothetical protein